MNNILRVWEEMFPNASCELVHKNVFELVIAVMLSAQTTDKSVNIVTEKLFQKYQSPEDYLNASIDELENDLRRIGLYRNKAKNIKLMCKMIIEEFSGEVPRTRAKLMTLPGVGRKTANVVLSVGFHVPAVPVDTHVERIAKRLKLAKQNDSVLKVEEKLKRKIPRDLWNKTHHQMIFFGRYHCKAKNPMCTDCLLRSECSYIKRKK